MTDEELVARMRQVEWGPCQLAADRIEALAKESAEMEAEAYAHIELWGKALREKAAAEARAERLEAALRIIGGNNCITCSAEAFNALFAEKHPAAMKGAGHD